MLANPPKIAIVCYSKSGHSRAVADRLAKKLDADVFALTTPRYHMPFLGYLRAGLDSLRQNSVPLNGALPDIEGYDAAIVCGPVWTSYPAVPLCTYFRAQQTWPSVLGLLLTNGDHSPPEKAFTRAEAEIAREFAVKDAISNDIEDTPEAEAKLTAFADDMRASLVN